MTEELVLTDAAERTRIAEDLDATLFVEAGAGSGKTKSLVDRVGSMVAAGEPIRHIAAITFTEKAAAELRDRIRRELERTAAEHPDPEVRARAEQALDDLDTAAIGTLHSFAQRLLTERAVEAGIPPRIEVIDEVASSVASDERWAAFVQRLLSDPDSVMPLRICRAVGVELQHLRTLGRRFEQNWDLLADRLDEQPPPLPSLPDIPALVGDVEATLVEFIAQPELLNKGNGQINKNAQRCHAAWTERAEQIASVSTAEELVRALKELPGTKAGRGPDPMLEALCERLGEARAALSVGCLRWLGHHVGRAVLTGAEQRRSEATLEFHDLLVLARRLLRTSPEARASLAQRYRRILLDEFQDTDPIQIEIATLLAAADPLDPALGETPWEEIEVRRGALFFVGDPKQSIYRFRRADISLFLRARERFGPPVELTTNFRSGEPVIEWVNRVCEGLISYVPDSQPEYRTLVPVHDGTAVGPPVALLDSEHDRVGHARIAEGRGIAGAIQQILDEGWTVRDGKAPGGVRPARRGDICILLPGRNSLDSLHDALEDAGIPYRTDASTLVYAAEEVRELLAALRAIDDPSDSLSQVTALRSPIFGCGDDDLVTFRTAPGVNTWSLLAPEPPSVSADHPVVAARRILRALHERRRLVGPAELAEELLAATYSYENQAARGRSRERWRRLRFVVDQARAWSATGDGSLRGYLRWVARQASETSRVSESVLPESDTDAVRIMTIHSAKGLEFPICIIGGLATLPGGDTARVQVRFRPDGIAYRAGRDDQEREFAAQQPVDEQMDRHERVRLLYVALTRACDHLVVSLHRRKPNKDHSPGAENVSLAQRVRDRLDELGDPAPVLEVEPSPGESDDVASSAALLPFEEWAAARQAALDAGRRRATVSATAVAHFDTRAGEDTAPEVLDDEERTDVDPGLQKQGRNLELPPWQKGRYGTAVGRAVHAVLQSVDLATGDGLDDAVRSQAAAEGLLGREGVIEHLARSALESEAVREAAAGEHWKEMFVAAPLEDGTTIEGYLDLVHRSDDGLVVVDYKTDAVPDGDALDLKVDTYGVQLGAYALALEKVLGERVARCRLVFLREDGAQTVDVPDLDARRAEAETRAASLARS